MAELDFVMEMAHKDEPDRYSFSRLDEKPVSDSMAQWKDRLAGKAFMWFMTRTGIFTANKNAIAWAQRRSSGNLRLGVTRGGKGIDDNAISGNSGAEPIGERSGADQSRN